MKLSARRSGAVAAALTVVVAVGLANPSGRARPRTASGSRDRGATTSCRPATTAACRRRSNHSISCRCTTGSRRCAATSPTPTSPSTTCPRTSSPWARRTSNRPADAGTTIVYDSYGVPHITGKTRADLAFGAGWVTARDRGLLLQLGRGPARVAVADVPGIDAFGLVTSGQSFVPSAQTEQLLTDQANLIVRTYGDKGREIIAEAQAEADGINAYWAANHIDQPPATVNDVIAVTAFIGSIFGAGGGAEATNAQFLSELQNHLGAGVGRKAWDDAMLFNDPEAPTTTNRTFDYGEFTGGRVTGAVSIDEGSIVSLDPRQPAAASRRQPRPLAPPPRRPTDRSRRIRRPDRCRRSRRRTSSSSRRNDRRPTTASR